MARATRRTHHPAADRPRRADQRGYGVVDFIDPYRPLRRGGLGVGRPRDPAGAAPAIRSAGGRAVPGTAVTAAERYGVFERRWVAIDQFAAGTSRSRGCWRWRSAPARSWSPADDWAEILVQAVAFAHVQVSLGCRGFTTWRSGRFGAD